jgi:hypothetical protein
MLSVAPISPVSRMPSVLSITPVTRMPSIAPSVWPQPIRFHILSASAFTYPETHANSSSGGHRHLCLCSSFSTHSTILFVAKVFT